MPDTPTSIFISYSRSNSDFVDRLEADLQARNFHTWVDRAKLEGGQRWLDKIQEAIEKYPVLLLVLSPEAIASEYVKMEYRYAMYQGKLVIPLEYKACPKVPIDLNGIQWINFKESYEQGLKDLLIALNHTETLVATAAKSPSTQLTLATEEEESELVGHPVKAAHGRIADHLATGEEEPELVVPRPAPSLLVLNLNDLYKEGMTARAEGDLERTVVLWQQILDRDPNFRNGTLAPQIKRLTEELQALRVLRLRQRAQQASQAGEWGQEIGAWKALLELEPEDEQARRCLALAEHNQQYASYYEDAQQFVEKGMVPSAREQLKILWSDAPYYGDPAGLVKKLEVEGEVLDPSSYAKKAEEEAEVAARAARRKTHQGFIKEVLGTNRFVVWICLFCLLSGFGSTVGILAHSTQIWPWVTVWTVGTVAFGTLLAYILGYRRTMNVLTLIGIAMISGAVAFGLGGYASVLNYNMPHTSQLWLIGTQVLFIGRQVDFGLIIGAIASVFVYFMLDDDFGDAVAGAAFAGAYVGLIGWLVVALVGAICGFGLGFGEGWYVGLLTFTIGIAGGVGLSASVALCYKALFEV